MDTPVFDTPMGPRALGRDTPLTVAHWDRLVAGMQVAPRIFRDAGQAVPTKSPDIRRFHYDSFLSQRSKGYCVGFNSCATVMTRLRIPADATATTGEPLPEIKLSPLFMYDISRMEAAAEGINLGRGDGSIGSCAGRGSMKWGVCDWDDDPGDAASVDSHRNDTTPPEKAQAFGKLHLVKAMALADSFAHGKELVAAGIPASICSDIPSGMMRTDAKGFFRMTGGVVGGHDYQWIDFDESLDLAWIGQCWPQWGEQSSDPRYAQRGGYTQVGTCPLSELERWYSPRAMSNGSSEIIVYNTVDGFAPTMLDLGSWA
jgi:hypothetical protein